MWDEVDARQFFLGNQDCSTIAAVFRLAYELPHVSRVAVSVSTAEHLAELVAATSLQVDNNRITRYRSLLRTKALNYWSELISRVASRRVGLASGPA
jgi:hypothetical protein